MPQQLTYPGVYVEEVPSGVHTITGVATSVTAFIGRALRGPVNEPTVLNSNADFERVFGPLWVQSSLGFAVRDFFANGGSQAIVVRLFHPDDGAGAPQASAVVPLPHLTLRASSPGGWGNNLRARVDNHTRDIEAGESAGELFNLTVRDTATGVTEQFRNVSAAEHHPRRVDKVIAAQSTLVAVAENGFTIGTRPDPHNDPPAGTNIWAKDSTFSAGVPDDADHKASDGAALVIGDYNGTGKEAAKAGLYALEKADLFNLLCLPPYNSAGIATGLIDDAAAYCQRRRAVLLVDPPPGWTSVSAAITGVGTDIGAPSRNAALYFPRLLQANPTRDGQVEEFAPCGAVAGVIARTDAERGVWKAPAGQQAALVGVLGLSVPLTDAENGQLNPLGVNCLRALPAAGRVIWGARTRQGDDRLASEWKYLPVRRTALYIEESLYRGTQWVVFEPNAEPLWAQIRLNVGAFMHGLFLQGAFAGQTRREAYFVKCDKETTTETDTNLGIVNIVVGFAPLKPAEFVVIKLQQLAGQTVS
jgi:phage tail sheath protein FI